MSPPRSDKEMTDLSTHVLLCADRYDSVLETLKKQNKILYAVAIAVTANLLGFTLQDIIKLVLG